MRALLLLAVLAYHDGGPHFDRIPSKTMHIATSAKTSDTAPLAPFDEPSSGLGPTFSLTPGLDAGISALPDSITVNGTTLSSFLCYKATDATATTWPPCDGITTTGSTLAITEDGASPTLDRDTPMLDASEGVLFGGGDYFASATSAYGDITTEDLIVEWCGVIGSGIELPFAHRSTAGWYVSTTTGGVFFNVDDGPDLASTGGTTGAVGNAVCMLALHDAGLGANGLMAYVNGVAATGANNAAVGSLTDGAVITNGAGAAGANNSTGTTFYVRAWKCAACLDNSDLTEEASIARSRAAMVEGLYPRVAGAPAPTTHTRASVAWVRKYDAATGVTSMHLVGSNWLRTNKTSLGMGYYPDDNPGTSDANRLLQSEDMSTTWTNVDATTDDVEATDVASQNDPLYDNADTSDSIACGAADEECGWIQTVATGVTAVRWTYSVWMKAGASTWGYIDLDDATPFSAAKFSTYVNLATCAAGTSSGSPDTVSAEDYGNGWCRVALTFLGTVSTYDFRILAADADNDIVINAGDGATANIYVLGAQLDEDDHVGSYVRTTLSAGMYAADDLRFAVTGNVVNAQGSGVIRASTVNYNTITAATFGWDFGAMTSADSTGCVWSNVTNDIGSTFMVDGGVVQASVAGTTDTTDGTARVSSCTWNTNDARFYHNGISEGTPDTAVTPDLSTTAISVGTSRGITPLKGLLHSLKFYSVPGIRQ